MDKKILLITFSDNADHQEILFGMYEALVDEHDIYLLAISTPKVALKRSERTWLVNCPKRPGVTGKTFNFPLLFSIIRKIRKENFDVLYFETLHVWNLPIMILSGKVHTYQVIHDVVPHKGDSQERMIDLMNRTVVKLADTIVLCSKTHIQDMAQRYRISSNRVKTLELWKRYPSYTKPTHSKRILFFGRINPYKGADNLLEIAQLCPEIQFDVVGRADLKMQATLNELKSQPNVTLVDGYVTDQQMRDAFIQCDWVIIPYNSASQSGVIIDAYRFSRPIVAFAVGAIPEQVEDGRSGYLIKAGDNAAFVKKLKEVSCMETDQYDAISREAYEYGNEKYGMTSAVVRFRELVGI